MKLKFSMSNQQCTTKTECPQRTVKEGRGLERASDHQEHSIRPHPCSSIELAAPPLHHQRVCGFLGLGGTWLADVFWSILEHMGHKEHGGTWHMEAAQLDTQRKKGEAILKTSSTVYSTNRSSSSTRPAKLQLDRAGSQSQTRKMLLPP
ncbi:unnamed protein product [Microthlaspi erraticum]|uniref:Uncharacterized protein n=1 Tax=Microthlaspi erraticum TaxID=1685480 RepID=A0A6D2L4L9_9BRAS|nr:unnamed protein product [Microthlaspi erraticum]